LLDIVRHIQEHREDKLTNILGSIRVQHSPETKSRENVFPIMKKYGIPLEERRVHKGLLKELFHMGKKVDKSTTLYADVGDNKESAFVFIPTSKGYKRLKKTRTNTSGSAICSLHWEEMAMSKTLFVTCLFMWGARRSTKKPSLKQSK
jgi:hypothetical protein